MEKVVLLHQTELPSITWRTLVEPLPKSQSLPQQEQTTTNPIKQESLTQKEQKPAPVPAFTLQPYPGVTIQSQSISNFPEEVSPRSTDNLATYSCDCGRVFKTSQAKAGHCHFCPVHLSMRIPARKKRQHREALSQSADGNSDTEPEAHPSSALPAKQQNDEFSPPVAKRRKRLNPSRSPSIERSPPETPKVIRDTLSYLLTCAVHSYASSPSCCRRRC